MLEVKRLYRSFKHAFQGLVSLVKKEQNFRIHVLAALVVIFFGFYFRIEIWKWCLIILMICFVFILEMLNTVFERLVDMLKPRIHLYVGEIKDIMSAMVLVVAITAVILALFIFVPYFFLS